jgi:nucleoside-diphosphate-sugar epimerase
MIFLTGGTGLLGLHIVDELRSRSIAVKALVRTGEAGAMVAERGAIPVVGNVEDPKTWASLSACSGIIHVAAIIAGRYNWDRYLEVNVNGTRLAAERARQLGAPLIHISSVAVYGRNLRTGELIDESRAFGPLTSRDYYARSKRLAEEAVWREADRGLAAVTIRPCVVYGEGDRLFLPKVVRALEQSWRVPIIGKGDRPLSLVHARSVAQAVGLAIATPDAFGQAYNVTNDDAITAREFVSAVGRGLGRELRTIEVPARAVAALAKLVDRVRSVLLPVRYPGSLGSAIRFWHGGNPYTSERARRVLGWRPTIRHAEGVENATRVILSAAKDLLGGARDPSLRSG